MNSGGPPLNGTVRQHQMIIGEVLVTSYFGYWPEFSDGKITRLTYERTGDISISITYIDADKRKAAEVSLKFSNVSNIELTDFKSENVIDVLAIEGADPVAVSLDACYGLSGQFTCERVEVVEVLPNNKLEADREA